MKLFKANKGIHIPGRKDATALLFSEKFLNPEYVYIPLSAKGTDFDVYVKPGDLVKLGQKIARRTEDKGLPIVKHATVSGEVLSISERKLHRTGLPYVCIKIKNDFLDTKSEEIQPIHNLDEVDNVKLLEIMRESGLVGLGGSGFPTYLKYKNASNIDTIILNGAECEPYITSDYRIMLEETGRVIDGLLIMMKAASANNGIIASAKDIIKIKIILSCMNSSSIIFNKKTSNTTTRKSVIVLKVSPRQNLIKPGITQYVDFISLIRAVTPS